MIQNILIKLSNNQRLRSVARMALSHFPLLRGKLINLRYKDSASGTNISQRMNYNQDYLQRIKNDIENHKAEQLKKNLRS